MSRPRAELVTLSAKADEARARVAAASAQLADQRDNFFDNPVNLLLPFVAGVLGGAAALHPRPARKDASRAGIAARLLMRHGQTLWRGSEPLRMAVMSEYAARQHQHARPRHERPGGQPDGRSTPT